MEIKNLIDLYKTIGVTDFKFCCFNMNYDELRHIVKLPKNEHIGSVTVHLINNTNKGVLSGSNVVKVLNEYKNQKNKYFAGITIDTFTDGKSRMFFFEDINKIKFEKDYWCFDEQLKIDDNDTYLNIKLNKLKFNYNEIKSVFITLR